MLLWFCIIQFTFKVIKVNVIAIERINQIITIQPSKTYKIFLMIVNVILNESHWQIQLLLVTLN